MLIFVTIQLISTENKEDLNYNGDDANLTFNYRYCVLKRFDK